MGWIRITLTRKTNVIIWVSTGTFLVMSPDVSGGGSEEKNFNKSISSSNIYIKKAYFVRKKKQIDMRLFTKERISAGCLVICVHDCIFKRYSQHFVRHVWADSGLYNLVIQGISKQDRQSSTCDEFCIYWNLKTQLEMFNCRLHSNMNRRDNCLILTRPTLRGNYSLYLQLRALATNKYSLKFLGVSIHSRLIASEDKHSADLNKDLPGLSLPCNTPCNRLCRGGQCWYKSGQCLYRMWTMFA